MTDEGSGETRFVSLADADIRRTGSIFDQALEYITESRERRRTRLVLRSMVKAKGDSMKKDLTYSRELHRSAIIEAAPHRVAGRIPGADPGLIPLFTSGERAAIERFIERGQAPRVEAPLKRLLELSKDPVSSSLSSMIAAFAPGEKTTDQRETEISQFRFGPEDPTLPAETTRENAAPYPERLHDPRIPRHSSGERPQQSREPGGRADDDRNLR